MRFSCRSFELSAASDAALAPRWRWRSNQAFGGLPRGESCRVDLWRRALGVWQLLCETSLEEAVDVRYLR